MRGYNDKLSDDQDDVLVMRAKDGDQDAFSTLFLRYKGEVYICLIQVVRNDEVVKDLLQDTYVKAWGHIRTLIKPSRFKTWLLVIARNLGFDWLRRTLREKTGSLEGQMSTSDAVNEKTGPEGVVETDYVLYVLAEMEPVLRDVLLLSAAGYSRAEIARQLGYKESTIRTYQSKARKQLRELYRMMDYTDGTRKEK
jgi:RNA polymerase sigma-70 factor (ECF subfamily)